MAHRDGGVAFTVESLENKSVWLDISDVCDADVECVNENIVAFRGRTAQFLNRLLKSQKRSVSAHEPAHGSNLPLTSNDGCRFQHGFRELWPGSCDGF